ncbi:RidA family protein [Acinetobacter baumannii]|uniref:RidA family protein n=1 Tax=Acinetobacter baumannii TaxID=470 RepID=UPI000810D888|nr:RidA family protein [Acinetobacter baumannii]MDC4414431.1 RidA family protein [Acinetobacter baumannii]MDC4531228.1 RidA family protein [Acinetobacter baumannii]MDC5668565.1 RidA family protein [Acinetobacter baumannii]MDC5679278.1 RidA family protein [Acinetobacter baumannii]MDH2520308.1 RidA family protein [Acinetobacter baumannii]
MSNILRIPSGFEGRSWSSAYQNFVWSVAVATDTTLGIEEQAKQTLENLAKNLENIGSSKQHIISAQVYLTDMKNKIIVDQIWNQWIGSNPEHWPQRACLGVALGGNLLIEVTVTAILNSKN